MFLLLLPLMFLLPGQEAASQIFHFPKDGHPKFTPLNETHLVVTFTLDVNFASIVSITLHQEKTGSNWEDLDTEDSLGSIRNQIIPLQIVTKLSPSTDHSGLFIYIHRFRKDTSQRSIRFSYNTRTPSIYQLQLTEDFKESGDQRLEIGKEKEQDEKEKDKKEKDEKEKDEKLIDIEDDSTIMIIGLSVGLGVFVLIVLVSVIIYCRNNKTKSEVFNDEKNLDYGNNADSDDDVIYHNNPLYGKGGHSEVEMSVFTDFNQDYQ